MTPAGGGRHANCLCRPPCTAWMQHTPSPWPEQSGGTVTNQHTLLLLSAYKVIYYSTSLQAVVLKAILSVDFSDPRSEVMSLNPTTFRSDNCAAVRSKWHWMAERSTVWWVRRLEDRMTLGRGCKGWAGEMRALRTHAVKYVTAFWAEELTLVHVYPLG